MDSEVLSAVLAPHLQGAFFPGGKAECAFLSHAETPEDCTPRQPPMAGLSRRG